MPVNMSHWCSCSTNSRNHLLAFIFLWMMGRGPGAFAAPDTAEIRFGQTSYQVELALTPAQRRQGLMYREHLARYGGMLLVYPRSGDHRIWMKNMRIPLRVLWIDEQFRVVQIKRLVPCQAKSCPAFSAPLPVRYVLELSDADHGVAPGDRIEELSGL